MTPVQHWFLAENAVPSHLHQVVRVTMPAEGDVDALRAALDDLVEHHDVLRQRFGLGADGWRSSIDPTASSMPFEVAEVETLSDEAVAQVEQRIARPMDVDSPPLARAALVRTPEGEAVLCIAAHHLVVDAVSWSHLVDDLDHLYRQRCANTEPQLPGVMTSVKQWVELLGEAAPGIDPEPWLRIVQADAGTWPGDRAGSLVSHRVGMSPELTAALVTGASEWQMGVDEIIAAAAARTLAEIQDSPRVRLFIEGHGRESDSEDVDVARTMGWFTALFPVAMEVPRSLSPDRAALRLRDQIRAASASGRDYGVLRYLHGDPAVRESLALDSGTHGVVNYLGRVAAPRIDGSMQREGVIRLARPVDAAAAFGAEITAYIDDDVLVLDWTGNDGAVLASAVSTMAAHITDLIDAFSTPGRGGAAEGIGDLDDSTMRKLAAALGTAGDAS
jgi:hypothetical protein